MTTSFVVVSFLSDSSLSDGCVGHTSALVRMLQDAGCEVGVVSLASSKTDNVGGVQLHRSPPTYRGMLSAAGVTIREVFRRRPGLLVCTSLGAPFNPLITLAARMLGVPVLFDCQDPPTETMKLLFGNTVKGRALSSLVAVGDRILRRCVCWTFSVSAGVDDILRGHGWRMPIYRFYNDHGLDSVIADTPPFGLRRLYGWEDAAVVIYAGGMQPKIRGIETQIEAVALAQEEGANVKFVAFGNGDTAPFRRLAQSLGVEQHVEFHDAVRRDELQAALSEADAAVMSTLPFALPSKVFEYVACGLRVICDDSNRDILRAFPDCTTTFDGTPGSLAKVLLHLPRRSGSRCADAKLARFREQNRASVTGVLSQFQ